MSDRCKRAFFRTCLQSLETIKVIGVLVNALDSFDILVFSSQESMSAASLSPSIELCLALCLSKPSSRAACFFRPGLSHRKTKALPST